LSYKIIIPARYGATRLAAKPLQPIANKPLIQWVYECAQQTQAEQIIIATDHDAIADVVRGFAADVCMTSTNHASGSDRLAEVVAQRNFADDDIVVNLQGDEPLMPAEVIDQVAANLALFKQANTATLCTPIQSSEALIDPHVVKVVRNFENFALYFSRAPIPWDRDGFVQQEHPVSADLHFRHIGLYAYRVGFLKQFVRQSYSRLEQHESLEQLRILYYGGVIHCDIACKVPGPGVDTEADRIAVERLVNGK